MKRQDHRGERLVRVTEDTHLQLRLLAAARDITLGEAVAQAVASLKSQKDAVQAGVQNSP